MKHIKKCEVRNKKDKSTENNTGRKKKKVINCNISLFINNTHSFIQTKQQTKKIQFKIQQSLSSLFLYILIILYFFPNI